MALQNESGFPGNPKPSICIKISDPDWQFAYQNWIAGSKPTNSEEWKKGVFACFSKANES